MLWVYANCVVILAGYAANIAIANSREASYEPSRRQRRQLSRRFKGRPHYTLRTDNCSGRQPCGSNLYHSPSGISKLKTDNGKQQ